MIKCCKREIDEGKKRNGNRDERSKETNKSKKEKQRLREK